MMHGSMSIKFMYLPCSLPWIPHRIRWDWTWSSMVKKIVAKCLSHGMDYQASITVMQKTWFSFRELHQTLDIHLTWFSFRELHQTLDIHLTLFSFRELHQTLDIHLTWFSFRELHQTLDIHLTWFSFRELHQTLDIHLTCILYCNDNCTKLTLTTESQTHILLTANNYSHLPHYLTHSFCPLVISYQLAYDRMLHNEKKIRC